MLNLNELETKWLRYKIKSYIPHAIILTSLIVIVFVIASFDFTPKKVIKTPLIKKDPIIIVKKAPKPIVIKPVIKKEVIEKKIPKPIVREPIKKMEDKKTVLKPSMNFIRSLKNDSPAYYNESPKRIKKVYKKHIPIKKSVKKPIQTFVKEQEIEIVPDSIINIKRENTFDDVQHVIKRFKKSNDPALSLFIAKKYYELKNYTQAYNYSLITNEINNNIEDSWIIFAKSLVKLNKKDKAIAILNKYINHSNSQKAKLLVENIISGKLQ